MATRCRRVRPGRNRPRRAALGFAHPSMSKIRESVIIKAPAERVWAVVQEDVVHAPRWTTNLEKVEKLDAGAPRAGTRYRYHLDLPGGIKETLEVRQVHQGPTQGRLVIHLRRTQGWHARRVRDGLRAHRPAAFRGRFAVAPVRGGHPRQHETAQGVRRVGQGTQGEISCSRTSSRTGRHQVRTCKPMRTPCGDSTPSWRATGRRGLWPRPRIGSTTDTPNGTPSRIRR